MAHALFFSLLFFSALSTATIADDGVFMSKLLKAITPTPSGWSNSTFFCHWKGVQCDSTNRVTSISLYHEGLTGTLPSDFNSLSQLTTLELSLNAFIGPLPSFANLTLLTTVHAGNNNFTFIPDGCFKGLTNLQDVILSNNVNLAPWTFPTYLAPLSNLSNLDLKATNMEGTLPNIFNSFHSLKHLYLSYNNITGVLPDTLAQSPIENLWLNSQMVGLSGSIGVLSKMIHLSQVWLDHNMFTGPIPNLSNCTSLFSLQLQDNFLSGEVSPSLAGLSKLLYLSLENNMLRGSLPVLGNDVLVTFNPINRMCPNSTDGLCDQMVLLDVAEAFGNPVRLINSWQWNNPCQNWSFITCENGIVTAVKLAKQGLTGTISPEFANLVNLVTLDLSGNALSGSIPSSLETLPQLETLDVSYNNLSGLVPAFLPRVKLNIIGNVLLPSSKGNGPSSRANPSTIAIASGSSTGILTLVSVIVIICNRKRCLRLIKKRIFKKTFPDHNAEEFIKRYGSLVPKHYSYSEVKKSTKLFQDKLGQGGFGVVYKATLPDGRHAAVKVISESKGSGEEFINEVVSISKTSHVNIVSLLGFCYEMNKRALIYEFMPNGSLDKFVHKRGSPNTDCVLDLNILYKITIGIAQGLAYLHRGCGTRILHLDIKPQNILLDEDFCPKISDFGLAKICKKKESIVSILGTRGTIGYIAPEVLSRTYGGVSHKSDVYSYGMLVLEMVGVRKSHDSKESHTTEVYFPDWIYKDLEQDNIHSIFEHITKEENEMVRKMIIMSLWCIQTNPIDRPSMSKVVEMLEGPLQSMPFPPKPSSPDEAPLQLLEISSSSLYATNSITIREDVSLSQMSSRKQKSSQGQKQLLGEILQEVQRD